MTAMSRRINQTYISHQSADTESLGRALGRRLRGGEVIELASDLGGGKTTLVRGLAAGAGSKDRVASPTFTISKQYQAGKLLIEHFDFYRLPEAGLIEHELADWLSRSDCVVVVEWADVVSRVLPADHLRIELRLASGDRPDERQITLTAPPALGYLLEADK